MLATLLTRSTQATVTASVPSRLHSRIEVCPPARRDGSPWWLRVQSWLRRDAPLSAPPTDDRLELARQEFGECLHDCLDAWTSMRAGDVLMRVNTARSMRELWHLRASVYEVIALHHSQWEAEQRVARLNRHFPTRAPRSGFVPLEP